MIMQCSLFGYFTSCHVNLVRLNWRSSTNRNLGQKLMLVKAKQSFEVSCR